MQNRATINLFLGTCMSVHYSGNALVGPSMCSFMTTSMTRRGQLNSLLKFSIFRNLMVLIDRNSHYLYILKKPLTSILKTPYVDV